MLGFIAKIFKPLILIEIPLGIVHLYIFAGLSAVSVADSWFVVPADISLLAGVKDQQKSLHIFL